MTNAEWMIKNNIPFKKVGYGPCSNPSCESIGYYDMDGNFNEGYKGTWLGTSLSEGILIWLDMEHKEPPILDESERQYLSAVIRPFRDDVQYIVKCAGNGFRNFEDIIVNYKYKPCDCADAFFGLPPFKKGTMYKGMKLDKKYTLKELGL